MKMRMKMRIKCTFLIHFLKNIYTKENKLKFCMKIIISVNIYPIVVIF